MPRTPFVLSLLLSPFGLAGCSPPPVLDQQLYIWQRQWRPAHIEALARTRRGFSTLRVLARQAHPKAGWPAPSTGGSGAAPWL